jgi:hypothetical protein
MGRRRQTKEQFIKSRETARATEAKAAEAKRIQDQALARRNINRTRLDLYRSKLRQQPAQPGLAANPIGSLKPNPRSVAQTGLNNTIDQIEASNRNLPKPAIQPEMRQQPMAKNAIGSAVGNQVIGGSGKSIVQPGLQDGGFVLPQSEVDFNNNSISTPKQGQDVYGRQSNTMASGLNTNVSDNMSTGSNALQPDNFSNITQQDINNVSSLNDSEKEEMDLDLSKLAIKPKEELAATNYKSFTVDDGSPSKDVMSARREALMKMMGGGY